MILQKQINIKRVLSTEHQEQGRFEYQLFFNDQKVWTKYSNTEHGLAAVYISHLDGKVRLFTLIDKGYNINQFDLEDPNYFIIHIKKS